MVVNEGLTKIDEVANEHEVLKFYNICNISRLRYKTLYK